MFPIICLSAKVRVTAVNCTLLTESLDFSYHSVFKFKLYHSQGGGNVANADLNDVMRLLQLIRPGTDMVGLKSSLA